MTLNLIIKIKNRGRGGAFALQEHIASVNNLLREPLCHSSFLGCSTLPCWVWDRRHSAPSVTGSFWKSDSQGEMDGVKRARPAGDWDLTAFFPLYSGQSGVGVASILHKFLLFFSHSTSRLQGLEGLQPGEHSLSSVMGD